MTNLHIPPEFYSESYHLYGAMTKAVELLEIAEKSVDDIVRILPKNLREAPAFKDAITGIWRYDFGDPYVINGGREALFGTDQCPPVQWLYRCIVSMEKILTNSQLLEFLDRLGNPSKHLEALTECSPLLVLREPANVGYEVIGFGQGNKRIDFYIQPSKGVPVLIDAKCRIRELIRKLPQTSRPDPSGLFKSLPEKFVSQDPGTCLQGGWIYSVLKWDKAALHSEFDQTDASRLHFAVLACWDKQAYVLSRNSDIERQVRSIFDLPDDDSIVIK